MATTGYRTPGKQASICLNCANDAGLATGNLREVRDSQFAHGDGGAPCAQCGLDVMDTLGDKVDDFLLGGIAGELFLRAAGRPVGFDLDPETDLYDSQWEANGETIEGMLDDRGEDVTLATDLAYEDEGGDRAEVAVDDIDEKDRSYLDVGTDTAEGYADVIRDSEAVFVKGALGMFEDERFSVGTVTALEAIAETDCFSVVGGGDTSRAIEMYDMDEADFSHVSIAGGAYIRALTGAKLAGVEALER
jgi:phosphoglycerate kinase